MRTETGTDTTDRWYAVRASNTEARYGWGTESEADAYVARLNATREINVYYAAPVEDAALIAELDADAAQDGSRGFSLADEQATDAE